MLADIINLYIVYALIFSVERGNVTYLILNISDRRCKYISIWILFYYVVLEEETWYWWVVGVCLGLIVILILALVVLPYWMWRNRVILIMKIVHYFQRYEDNGM